MSREVLENVLAPFIDDGGRVELPNAKSGKMLTKVDFFEHGLTGARGSTEKRDELCRLVGLPTGMTPSALLSAMNLIYSYDEAIKAIESIN